MLSEGLEPEMRRVSVVFLSIRGPRDQSSFRWRLEKKKTVTLGGVACDVPLVFFVWVSLGAWGAATCNNPVLRPPCTGLNPGGKDSDVDRTQLIVQLLQQATYAFEGAKDVKTHWRLHNLICLFLGSLRS